MGVYLSEVLQQIFIVFHIFKLIPELLGCVQIFQGLNEDMCKAIISWAVLAEILQQNHKYLP